MRKLAAFIQVSLDGCFASTNGDISWAHKTRDDAEWYAFVSANASSGGQLLFGRTTYEMMVSYWPTPMAMQNDPVVAEHMNALSKVVFSRTLQTVSWRNTTLVKDDMVVAVRRMKAEAGPDMAILGSGSIVRQLMQQGLIDELQVVVNPVVLGKGKALFQGVGKAIGLTLAQTRVFANGSVYLRYEPVA